jgi:hypothetical protein
MNNAKTGGDKSSGDPHQGNLEGQDKQQADLRNPPADALELPEGLQRPRRGPLDKDRGRQDQE